MDLPGIGWPGGSPEDTGIIIGVIAGAYVGALWLAAVVWIARDIRDRSRDLITQMVAVLMVIVFSFAGWVLYLVLRPRTTLSDLYERQLEEEALLQELTRQVACPHCGVTVQDDFVVCPHCAAALKEPCGACGRALTVSWAVCPWCANSRTALASPTSAAPSQRAPAPAGAQRTVAEPPTPEFGEATLERAGARND